MIKLISKILAVLKIIERPKVYTPPKVSRFYRYDWQYAIDATSKPYLRSASLIITVMPIVLSISKSIFNVANLTVPTSLWLLWLASVSFVISWTVLTLFCPKFVKEYRDYGTYKKRMHSHRWIVWEFYSNIQRLSGWQRIVQETEAKEIAFKITDNKYQAALNSCPEFNKQPIPDNMTIFYPINYRRDIYLPIHSYGDRVLLTLEEDDPKLEDKEKELFWILYTQAAKEKTFLRFLFWIFIHIAVLLIAYNVIDKIFEVIS